MTSSNVPVWIYAGPKAGTVAVMSRDLGERAEREQFGEILRSGNPKHMALRGPHPAAEAFHAEHAGHGYLDREMRAREPAPVLFVPDPVQPVPDCTAAVPARTGVVPDRSSCVPPRPGQSRQARPEKRKRSRPGKAGKGGKP